MQRLTMPALVFAVLAAAAALWFLLGAGQPGPEPVFELTDDLERAPRTSAQLQERPVQGGVYAGVVVDPAGQPIRGARVLLVAYGTGGPNMLMQGSGMDAGPEDLADVPILGSYTVGGEGSSDVKGAFRIAADSQSTITRVLAYHQGFFLDVVEVNRPREDIRIVLQPGGRVVGTVVDDESGRPISGAVVNLYLQQKVDKVPDLPGTSRTFTRKRYETAWLVTLGKFIGKELGPRIWDVVDSQDESLRLVTDANGHFEIGPLGNAVQLEFVITHPVYRWHDFDTDDGKQTPQRLVVEPGQTIEREFRLRKGLHVAGQVVDEQGNGLEDVYVKVQSISAYIHHWWYKHKWRYARTDRNGRFRVDGLTLGSQQLILQHPSFKEKTVSVEADTEDLIVVAERFGALRGVLEGVAASTAARRVLLLLESTEENPEGPRQQRLPAKLEPNGSFLAQRIPPGRYRAWVKAGKESSQPVEIEIEALATLEQTFEIGAGGALIARVLDPSGGIVDPASARLIAIQDGVERALGTFVAREGEFSIDGIAPGTYRLQVDAGARVSHKTEPFEINRDRVTNLGALTVSRFAYVSFGQPVNERGRPARIVDDLVIEIRLGAEGAWERVYNAGAPRSVRPGPVSIRARSGAMRFEYELEAREGETHPVKIVFPDTR